MQKTKKNSMFAISTWATQQHSFTHMPLTKERVCDNLAKKHCAINKIKDQCTATKYITSRKLSMLNNTHINNALYIFSLECYYEYITVWIYYD